MIVIHCITGSTPDVLITCVFGICGVEGGVMGWIKTSKNKLQKLKSERETCNNSSENSNCSLNYCEESEEIEEITEILEDENELEEETFE
jgi:coenzyme F420-reducing hydrogenase gamma subunit